MVYPRTNPKIDAGRSRTIFEKWVWTTDGGDINEYSAHWPFIYLNVYKKNLSAKNQSQCYIELTCSKPIFLGREKRNNLLPNSFGFAKLSLPNSRRPYPYLLLLLRLSLRMIKMSLKLFVNKVVVRKRELLSH